MKVHHFYLGLWYNEGDTVLGRGTSKPVVSTEKAAGNCFLLCYGLE
ncbi:hypothetical protein [Streptococcus caprae]